MVSLLFTAGMINYMDRSVIGVAAPVMQHDLGLGPAALGVIFSAFFAGYALFNFLGGVISDRVPAYRVFTTALVAWSVFCAATAAATGFLSLLIIRILFGFGEGPFGSAASKLVNNWFPRRESGTAMGFVNGGTPLGGAIAGPITGFLVLAFGWRVAFIAVSALSVVFLGVWLRYAGNGPEEDRRITAEERQMILAQRSIAPTQEHDAPGLWAQITRPPVLAATFAFFGYNYILYFFLSWFPSYLVGVLHLSVAVMSLVTVIPWLVGCVGLIAGGFLSDALYRRMGNPLLARKTIIIAGLGGSAVAISLAGLATSVPVATALVTAAVFLLYLTSASYWALIHDLVPQRYVGGASGFLLGGANISGIIGPAVTGFIVAWSGLFTAAFMLAGAITVLGCLGVAVFVRSSRMAPVPAV